MSSVLLKQADHNFSWTKPGRAVDSRLDSTRLESQPLYDQLRYIMTLDMTQETLAMTREDSVSRLMTHDSTLDAAPGKSKDSRLDSRLDSHDSCTALKPGHQIFTLKVNEI